MKSAKRVVMVVIQNERKVFVTHGSHPEWALLVNELQEGDIVKQTIVKINEKDRRREYHYAYLNRFIDQAHEDCTNGIYGETKNQKANTLDYTMRDKYCELHPELYTHTHNSFTGKESVYPFSISDFGCNLTDEQLDGFYKWSKEFLCNMHKEKYKYEIPYWLE